jgi:hypothetical protein
VRHNVAGRLKALERLRDEGEGRCPDCPLVAILNQYGDVEPEAPVCPRCGKKAFCVVAVLHRAEPGTPRPPAPCRAEAAGSARSRPEARAASA